jgi:sugar/nucleoside kinase (ribokinase family)
MTLFGLGTATLDLRISTADLGPEYRAKLLARSTETFGGGAAANALYQAALLGARTEWLGRLGRDTLGTMIADDLRTHRIGTTHVVRTAGALSPFNLAVYAGEHQRRIGGFLLPNCLADLRGDEVERFAGAVGPDDWVLVEVGEIPLPIVLDFCTAVKEAADGGASIVLDVDLDPLAQCVGGTRELMKKLFTIVDYVLPNRDAMTTLYQGLDAAALTATIAADSGTPVATTAGPDGCYYTDEHGEVKHAPSVRVDVVDAVGAGDAFHGGFVWSLMTGGTPSEAVHTGCLCGAANCRAFGARTGMVDAASLEQMKEGER